MEGLGWPTIQIALLLLATPAFSTTCTNYPGEQIHYCVVSDGFQVLNADMEIRKISTGNWDDGLVRFYNIRSDNEGSKLGIRGCIKLSSEGFACCSSETTCRAIQHHGSFYQWREDRIYVEMMSNKQLDHIDDMLSTIIKRGKREVDPEGPRGTKARVCQTGISASLIKIPEEPECRSENAEDIEINVYKKNIIQYEVEAQLVRVTRKECTTGTNFFGVRDTKKKSYAVGIEIREGIELIRAQSCPAPYSSSLSPVPPMGNREIAYDCQYAWLQDVTTVTTSCIFQTGKVTKTFGGHMRSNLGDVLHCSYESGSCSLHDGSIMVWTPEEEASIEYLKVGKFHAHKVESHYLIPRLGISLITVSGSKNGRLDTLEGFQIEVVETRKRRALEDRQNEILAKIQYLADLLTGPKATIQQLCDILKVHSRIVSASAAGNPTSFAQSILYDKNILARYSDGYLLVWPCREVEVFYRDMDTCNKDVPVTYEGKEGFLDTASGIISNVSLWVNCSSSIRMWVNNSNVQLLVGSSNMTVTPLSNAQPTAYFSYNHSWIVEYGSDWIYNTSSKHSNNPVALALVSMESVIDRQISSSEQEVSRMERASYLAAWGIHKETRMEIFGSSLLWILMILGIYGGVSSCYRDREVWKRSVRKENSMMEELSSYRLPKRATAPPPYQGPEAAPLSDSPDKGHEE